MMDEIAKFISNMGFPIFVAVFMLYKTTSDNEKMNNTLTELKTVITSLTDEIRHRNNDEGDKINGT